MLESSHLVAFAATTDLHRRERSMNRHWAFPSLTKTTSRA
jgi:hypothetical protein